MTQPIQLFIGADPALSRPKAGASATPRDGFATAMDRSARRQEPARATGRQPARDEAAHTAEGATRGPATPDEPALQAPVDESAAKPTAEAAVQEAVVQPSLHDPLVMLPGLVQSAVPAPEAPVQLAVLPVVTADAAPAAPAATPQVPLVGPGVQPGAAEAALAQGTALPAAVEAALAPALEAPVEAPTEEEGVGEEPPVTAEKKPRSPVMPLARQHVGESLETVKATMTLTGHDGALARRQPEMPLRAAAQAPVAHEVRPLPTEAPAPAPEAPKLAAAGGAGAQAALSAAPEVQPWELHHPVQAADAAAPQARVLEGDAPRGQAMPMREALKTAFDQAAREAGKPTELRLQLSPEHLGRMQIRVVSHQGTLSASIRVEQSATRDMMQVQMVELRQTLADQGIKLDRLEVSVGQDQRRPEPGFDLSGGFQQQSQQQGQEDAQGARRSRAAGFDEALDAPTDVALGAPVTDDAAAASTTVDYQA